MLQRIRRRDLILLSGLFSLACFTAVVMMMLILQSQPGGTTSLSAAQPTGTPAPQPTHTVVFVQITGLGQYPAAATAAQAWAQDAALVSATANWPYVTRLDAVGEPAEWNYRFYSPGRARLLLVTVDPDGRVQSLEHPVPVTLPPAVIPADTWVMDSPAALAVWLDYGGHQMLRTNPGLELMVQLRADNQQPQPVWTVLGVDSRTQEARMVMINAHEGGVVASQP
jgi:hypothetical protein